MEDEYIYLNSYWLKLKYIQQLMKLENEYHPNLREKEFDKYKRIFSKDVLEVVVLKEGKIIADRIGVSINETKDFLPEFLENYNEYVDRKILYVWSFTVKPEFQGQNIGFKLASSFTNLAKRLGYEKILGAAKEGASIHINEKLGAKIIKPLENWADTGTTHYLYELNLKSDIK